MSFSPEWLLTNLIAAFLLPPLNGLSLLVVGWALWRRRSSTARGLAATGLLLLWVQALPAVGLYLLGLTEDEPLSPDNAKQAQAIVVLGGGRYRAAPEYGDDTVNEATLARLRYAAKLHRETGLPILVSGGTPEGAGLSEGEAMRRTLEEDFGVPVRWVERRSINTRENAHYAASLLREAHITDILLVTDASHMPRAYAAFTAAGPAVTPAPTSFRNRPLTPLDFLPRSYTHTRIALHEWIGLLWYKLRR